MPKVVTVFGISGVGKSWLISRFATTTPVEHIQGSALLKEAKAVRSGVDVTSEDLRTGAVIDNQTLLVEAFALVREKATKPIIFDGHSVIDDGQQLIEISVSVVEALSPSGIIFIRDNPRAIVARRAADSRPRPSRTIEELSAHQTRGYAVCTRYAQLLRVDLKVVDSGDEQGFAAAVTSILAEDGSALGR